MQSRVFYILRHGETFVTKKRQRVYRYGRRIFSAHILEEGKPAIERMAKYLDSIKTDANFSSQFRRCRETVEIITEETNKQFHFDKRLNEFVFETPWHFKRRVKSFLDHLERGGFNNTLICTHGVVISELLRTIANEEVGYPDPGVLLTVKDGKVEALDFN